MSEFRIACVGFVLGVLYVALLAVLFGTTKPPLEVIFVKTMIGFQVAAFAVAFFGKRAR